MLLAFIVTVISLSAGDRFEQVPGGNWASAVRLRGDFVVRQIPVAGGYLCVPLRGK
jgi:hypothetical protein